MCLRDHSDLLTRAVPAVCLQRDEWYAYHMKKQEESTTDRMSLNVHAVTYNLAGKAPKDCDDSDLKLMLGTDEAKVDFYVVGLQEVIPLDISSAGLMVYGESERYAQWRERLHRVVGRDEYRDRKSVV